MDSQIPNYLSYETLPVGYWIKRADNLLTKGVNEIQASFGIKRIEWQMINLVHEKERVDKKEIIELLKPFADEIAVVDLIQKFLDNKNLQKTENYYFLSPKGLELYAACHARQVAFRKKAASNISQEDYDCAIRALKQLVENLSNE